MDGRDFVSKLPALPCPDREAQILQAVLDGHLAPIVWRPLRIDWNGHSAVFQVPTDALAIGETRPVRINVTHPTAEKIARHLGCVLPTAKLMDEMWAQADIRLPPFNQPSDPAERVAHGYSKNMSDVGAMLRHSDDIAAALVGKAAGIVSTVGKCWRATNRLVGRPTLSANYGLHDPAAPYRAATARGGKLWQPEPGTAHNLFHTDNKQVLIVVQGEVLVDGSAVWNVEDMARDPMLWGLVSSEGTIASMWHPAAPAPGQTMPDEEAAPAPIFTHTLRKNMVGTDVAAWQVVIGCKADGVFGPATEAATKRWQSMRPPLDVDGVVGPRTRAKALSEIMPGLVSTTPGTVLADAATVAVTKILAKNFSSAKRTAVHWILMHDMEAPEKPTTGEGVARWFAGLNGPAPQASTHWCYDCDSAILCVPEEDIAWHGLRLNPYSVGYEHAGYARQTREEWLDDYSETMLAISARIAAQVTIPRWKLPPDNYVDAAGLKRAFDEFLNKGEVPPDELRGFTAHSEVTKALGGTHTDPGSSFPWDFYLGLVRDSL